MIDRRRVEQIQDALFRGVPQRQIALDVGVCLQTVSRIATGMRARLSEDEQTEWLRRREAKRCSGCGGLVYQWPCLKCEIARNQRKCA